MFDVAECQDGAVVGEESNSSVLMTDSMKSAIALFPGLGNFFSDTLAVDASNLDGYVGATVEQLGEQFSDARVQPAVQRGSGEADLLLGGGEDDRLYGLAGDDKLYGGDGNDLLNGGTGRDWLMGDRGQDTLVDSDGGDFLYGGEGADLFRIYDWDLPEVQSVILDFEVGIDKIKIGRLRSQYEGFSFEQSASGTAVLEGDRPVTFLAGVEADSLSADSFIFGEAGLADKLQAGLESGLAASDTPGATQALYTPGDGFTWEGAAGFSNLEAQTQMRPDDVISIASTTKTFTAATVLKLVEAGTLALDETLAQWLPEISENYPGAQGFTLRRLLSGKTGILSFDKTPAYSALESIEANAAFSKTVTQEALVALTYGEPLFQETDRSSNIWSYTNTADVLVGLMVEKITGRPFAELMREQIIDPLGLENTSYGGQEPIAGNLSRSYVDFEGPDGNLFEANNALQQELAEAQPDATEAELLEILERRLPKLQQSLDGTPEDITEEDVKIISAFGPAGALFSNAEDTARFTRALLEGELLSDESLEELLRFQPTEAPAGAYYGLGLFSNTPNGEPGQEILLAGDSFGFKSRTVYLPENGTVISTLANREYRYESLLPEEEQGELNAVRPILENTQRAIALDSSMPTTV